MPATPKRIGKKIAARTTATASSSKIKPNQFYALLKTQQHIFDKDDIRTLLAKVDRARVNGLAKKLAAYLFDNLPKSIEGREGLASYRTNPYVLMTAASVMKLADPARLADFLFNSKLYMGLETSFGKSIEAALLAPYPLRSASKWTDPPEKLAEFASYEGLSREEKAQKRTESVWREIDKHVVVGKRRYLVSIKSGPNTINDSQVQAMTEAIINHHQSWAQVSRFNNPGLEGLDIVIGLTYGTDRTTNNKENQILAKLLTRGFEEVDRVGSPGVLVDSATRSIRLYRRIGREFWAFIGNPRASTATQFVFLEVLLALTEALSQGVRNASMEARINAKMHALGSAIMAMTFPKDAFPDWIRDTLTDAQELMFASAMTAFYDEGI